MLSADGPLQVDSQVGAGNEPPVLAERLWQDCHAWLIASEAMGRPLIRQDEAQQAETRPDGAAVQGQATHACQVPSRHSRREPGSS